MSTQHGLPARFLATLFALTGSVFAQFYNQSMWVPVTYYDYKADETNPNFQPFGACTSGYALLPVPGIRTGMVDTALNAERKPVLVVTGSVHLYHSMLNYWFRPSGATSNQLFTINNDYMSIWSNMTVRTGATNEWIVSGRNESDPMVNIVIYDSLEFLLVDTARGVYAYTDTAFFPIDTRGYGIQPDFSVCPGHDPSQAQHNYGFAMEMHRQFTHRSGLVYEFASDDDMWVFIDGRLVLDLGGMHGVVEGVIELDSLDLTEGVTYDVDVFRCERNLPGSAVRLAASIVSAVCPCAILLDIEPSASVSAGDSVILWAHVEDWLGVPRRDWADSVVWKVIPEGAGGRLSKDTGDSVVFYADSAGRFYSVVGRLGLPTPPPHPVDEDTVQILVLTSGGINPQRHSEDNRDILQGISGILKSMDAIQVEFYDISGRARRMTLAEAAGLYYGRGRPGTGFIRIRLRDGTVIERRFVSVRQ